MGLGKRGGGVGGGGRGRLSCCFLSMFSSHHAMTVLLQDRGAMKDQKAVSECSLFDLFDFAPQTKFTSFPFFLSFQMPFFSGNF